MTHAASGIIGCVFLGIAVLGFLYPVTTKGQTLFEANDVCSSGRGQVAQMLEGLFGGSKLEQICLEYKYATYGVVGIGLVGLILVIVGAVVPSNQKKMH